MTHMEIDVVPWSDFKELKTKLELLLEFMNVEEVNCEHPNVTDTVVEFSRGYGKRKKTSSYTYKDINKCEFCRGFSRRFQKKP
jgi:hypothetical protein